MFNVIFFLGYTNPFPGAGWRRIEFFARYLAKRGFNVYVIGTFSLRNIRKAGLTIKEPFKIFNICPIIPLNHLASILFNIIASFITLFPAFLIIKPHCVVISVPPGDSAAVAYFVSKISGCKIVFDYRDEWEDDDIEYASCKSLRVFLIFLKRLFTLLYRKSDAVLTVPPVDSLKRRGIKKILFLPNGADITIFKPYDKVKSRRILGFGCNDFIVFYLGAAIGYNNIDIIVKSIAKLIREGGFDNIKLVILGRHDGVKPVLRLATSLGIGDRVKYLGVRCDQREIAETICCGDAGLIPGVYLKSQLPVKFFEYCACELPILAIVPKDTSLYELVKKLRIGLAVPSSDVIEIAEAISKLYFDETFRREAGLRGRIFIENSFDRDKFAGQFLELLTNLD